MVINTFKDGKHFWGINNDENMTIDAIIGNPPYQVMDGGAGVSAVPVYHRFIDLSKKMKPHYLSMIMPAKWYNGGRGLDQFRDDMLNDRSIKAIYDYIDSHECFPTVDIAGGVCYILWDSRYSGDCNFVSCNNGFKNTNKRNLSDADVLIRHQSEVSILEKVQKVEKKFLSDVAYSQKPFGLRTYVKPLDKGDITLRYNGGAGPYRRDMVSVNANLIDKWKVITSCLTAEHAGETDKNGQKRILSTLEILPPGTICTETYMLLSTFDNKTECFNMMNYLKTKFVRALIASVTSTQHLSKSNFRYVPVLDYTQEWNDEKLFDLFRLSTHEIDFINLMIKSME